MTRLPAKDFARHLRRNQTEAETQLWTILRSRQILGYKFRRQQPINKFIVDFCCLQERLAIELDGGHHLDRAQYDTARDQYLKDQGFRILRFWDSQILQEMTWVMRT